MTETILKIRSVFDPKGANEAASSFKQLKNAASGLAGMASKANGVFSNFVSSLTRIAKLRLLRGIIRGITTAFKEGTQNIYQYSLALGAADASHFANTMDSLATSILYMKNSLGAIVAPLLTSLLPAIQTIVSWFVTATQAVAQFFAALGGQATYTRAKEHATAWKDIGTAAGGAAAAAKEYKNTIMSFDEIHALNDVPTSGGGGGGGADVPDYSDMFEEAPISSKIAKIAKWLRDNFDGILDIVKTIGITMAAWKIASGVVDFFSALGLGAGAIANRQFALGLTLTIAGVTLAASGGFDIGYDGVDLIDLIKVAIGTALGGIGGAMISVAAGGAAGVGLVVGFGIALIGSIIGFQLGQQEAMLDSTYRLTDSYQEFLTVMDILGQVMEHSNTVVTIAEKAWSDYNGTIANVKMAEYLIPQIEELANKTERSELENAKLNTYIETLNGLGLEGVSAAYDEFTGVVQINTEEIKNNLETIKDTAKQKAYIEILTAAWKDEAQATLDAQIAQDALNDTEVNLQNATQELLDYEREFGGTLEYDIDTVHQMEEKISDWADAMHTAQDAVDGANGRLDEAQQYAKDAERAFGNLDIEITNDTSDIKEFTDAVDEMNGTTYDGTNVTNGMSNVAWWADNVATKIKNAKDEMNRLNDAMIYTPSTVHVTVGKIGAYERALGGFVPNYANGSFNTADVFLANENNNPELIGRIGNRTAVANQGQMVDAMAIGVRAALSDIMGNGTSNTEVIVNMDSETVARAADRGNRSLNRRFNVSLA